jgi:hypothetical protein
MRLPTLLLISTLSLSLAATACSDDDGAAGTDAGGDGAVADVGGKADQGAAEQGLSDTGAPADMGVSADTAAVDGSPGGDGGISITCGAQLGTATTSGTVGGTPIGATHAGGVSVDLKGLSGFGVALLDQGGTCKSLAAVMSAPKLWLLLCDSKPGVYTIGDNCLGSGGGIGFPIQATIPSTGADKKADGGTITITELDTACGKVVKGSFALDFGTDTITGSFDSVGCGKISL